MRTLSQLRARAANAERLARRAASQDDRAQLLEIARGWRALAKAAEVRAGEAPPLPDET